MHLDLIYIVEWSLQRGWALITVASQKGFICYHIMDPLHNSQSINHLENSVLIFSLSMMSEKTWVWGFPQVKKSNILSVIYAKIKLQAFLSSLYILLMIIIVYYFIQYSLYKFPLRILNHDQDNANFSNSMDLCSLPKFSRYRG